VPLGNLFGPSEPARTPAKGSASAKRSASAADDSDEEREKELNEMRSDLAQLEAELEDSSQGDYCQGWVGIHICIPWTMMGITKGIYNVPENLLGSIWRQVGDPQKRYQKVIQNWA